MKRLRWQKLVLFLVLAVSLIMSLPLRAAEKSDEGLRITPLRSYPVQKPGETTGDSITLTNYSDQPIEVSLSTETFKVVNEDYDYAFEATDFTKWVRFVDSGLTLESQQSQAIAYTVGVPLGAPAGGYYLALIASTVPADDTQSIKEVRRVASLIYLEVSGDIKRETKLLNFDLPWLTLSSKFEINIRLANTGTSHNRSRLQVNTVRWPYHRGTDRQIDTTLLPATVRKLEPKHQLSGFPGVYKVSVEYAPPQGGITRLNKYVLYLPLWLIFTLLVLVATLVNKLLKRRSKG